MGDQWTEESGAQSSEDLLADPVWTYKPESDTETDDKSEDDKSAEDGEDQWSDGEDESRKDSDDGESKGEESKEEPKKEEKKEDKAPDTKHEIQVRGKSKTDFILERKQRQLEKAKAEKLAAINKELEEHGIESDDDDIDLDPTDEETVTKVIQKKYGKHFEEIERQRFENEVSSFLSTNEIAKHATPAEVARFKEYALHPSRAQVPFEELIVSSIGASRLMEIGAQREREAAKKAWASKVGGSVGSKSGDTKTDIASMTDEQFEAYQMKVRMGKA